MIRFCVKRIFMMIPVLLGVMLIVFCINKLSGDPLTLLLPADATQEQYDKKAAELGLDKPVVIQYINYVVGVVTRFDLGTSYETSRPVADEVSERVPTSIKLSLASITFAVVIGIPFGIISAIKQYSVIDYTTTIIAMFFASMPAFWLGLMAIIIFSLKLGWLPASGTETLSSWILPGVTLALSPIATITRTTRSSMLDVIRADYVRTARAKGLSEFQVIWGHALKNALIPVLTVVGMQIGFVFGGAMVVETVFTVPGIGSLLMTAIRQKNFPVILGSVLLLSIIVSFMNLLVDILYGFIDPRIRAQYAGKPGGKKKKASLANE